MSTVLRRWSGRALALLLFLVLSGCLVPGGGYVGPVYEPVGYVYGSWGPGYNVGPPPHGGHHRPPQQRPRAYRAAPQSVPAPSIPTSPHKHTH
jgi:hypothetical protein